MFLLNLITIIVVNTLLIYCKYPILFVNFADIIIVNIFLLIYCEYIFKLLLTIVVNTSIELRFVVNTSQLDYFCCINTSESTRA
jgi:hypothetical protein